MDGYEYQKRMKKELKDIKNNNKEPIDKLKYELNLVMGVCVAVIIFILLILTVLFMLTNLSIKESKNSCENLNGKYVVVDRQWSGKQMIDIYGCVK